MARIGTNYTSRGSVGRRKASGGYDNLGALLTDRTDRGPQLTERGGERREGPYGSGHPVLIPVQFQPASHQGGSLTSCQHRSSSVDSQLNESISAPNSIIPQQSLRARSSSPGVTQTMLPPDTQTMLRHDTQSMVRQLTQHPIQCGFVLEESPSSMDIGKLSTSMNLAEARIQQLRSDAERIRQRSLSKTSSGDPSSSPGVNGVAQEQQAIQAGPESPLHARATSSSPGVHGVTQEQQAIQTGIESAVDTVHEQPAVQTDRESTLAYLQAQEEALRLENEELQTQAMRIEHELNEAHQLANQREHEAAALCKRADMMEADLERIVFRLKTQEERCRSKDAEARARRAEVARLSELLEIAKGDLARQSAMRQAVLA